MTQELQTNRLHDYKNLKLCLNGKNDKKQLEGVINKYEWQQMLYLSS